MGRRVGYVVATDLPPGNKISNNAPRPEYAVFVERNDATLLDHRVLRENPSRPAQWMEQRGHKPFAFAFALLREAQHYDAILASGEDVGLPLAVLMRYLRRKTPLYIITHGSYFNSMRMKQALTLLRGMKSVHFLCLSKSLQRTLVERFGCPESQAHHAGYGVDCRFFQPSPSASNGARPIVASAGTANRDYKTLVSATRNLEADIRIAADSAWYPYAMDIANDELPANVEARSYGDYAGLRGLYAASSFVVVPLYFSYHACGYAVIGEAMAMGKAVIATRTGTPSDYIIEGETGFLVPPGDADALRERVCYLLNNPDEARRMGEAARKHVSQNYSVEVYCETMEQIMGLSPDRVVRPERTGEMAWSGTAGPK